MKVGKTYKYYPAELGRRAVLVGLKLKEHLIVPPLATASACPPQKNVAPLAQDFSDKG